MSKTVINRREEFILEAKTYKAKPQRWRCSSGFGIPGSWTDCQRKRATEEEELWLDRLQANQILSI